MEAVLVNRSRIEPKVAILKPISAAIAIGTGGPFGAEGPIIQTGGAVGSLVGPVDAHHRGRAQSAAGLRSGGRHGRDLQHADRRRDPRHRAAAVRVQVALVHSAGDRQHPGDQRSLPADGPGADVPGGRARLRSAARVAVLPGAGRALRRLRRWASASCCTGWKISSRSCRFTTCGGRRSARWVWASSATLCRACWAWATTPSPTS